ncbi:outer membrane lipoprotein carrier protein LolA [Pedobacter sp. BS3]|uniref:LolA family protein n=1 Tax=Pedobacter sp. BS3 TaxID=2567937 RepID=UPI0011ED8C1F|nr:outer membrane lipoprotein carrier protein LolA [Pedobacter sp. BS3]TZF84999.1 outer membrane lipoprotein carrier protein LolA [Pedobacter sp. BS3]
MNKIIAVSIFICSLTTTAFAQTDARAKAILGQVSKNYRSYATSKADFTYSVDDPDSKDKQTQTGTIYIKSNTDKYKLVFQNQEVISDGKNQWTYLKADKEVQLSEVDKKANSINPADIFTLYENGFKYVYTGDSKVNGKLCYTIDLSPTDINKPYFKVRLSIDKTAKRIAKAVVFNKDGSRYNYVITSFTPNVKLSDAIFTFDPKQHPGVELVDLR